MQVCEEISEGHIPPLDAPDDDGDHGSPLVVVHDAANPIGSSVSPKDAYATIFRASHAAGKQVQLVTTESYIYDHAWQTFGLTRLESAALLDVRDGRLYICTVWGCDDDPVRRFVARATERA